ncbi:hypothetical protein AMURIS_04698 [Acetatifactor muris]|uniref:Uncharacterized protein n=1 Tax=Acetatifactor muris TaxID=879566 RepID=A0A2K4ZNE0_9FIRM|nr:hypothetical protein AMURIS_04698 [Acetatifactor muris]
MKEAAAFCAAASGGAVCDSSSEKGNRNQWYMDM